MREETGRAYIVFVGFRIQARTQAGFERQPGIAREKEKERERSKRAVSCNENQKERAYLRVSVCFTGVNCRCSRQEAKTRKGMIKGAAPLSRRYRSENELLHIFSESSLARTS